MRVRLTSAAEADLDVINAATLQRFGLGQAARTREALRQAIEMLGEHPSLGHLRADLSPTGREFLYWTVLSRFMIVYGPSDHGIIVARVLNGARNLEAELADADDE